MEFSVMVMDAWGVKHSKPFSGRVLGVDSPKEAAVKWVSRFYDRNLKVESVTSRDSFRSANVKVFTLNCEGGKVFFLCVF